LSDFWTQNGHVRCFVPIRNARYAAWGQNSSKWVMRRLGQKNSSDMRIT
jgi:hypothetical protein